MRPKIVAAPPYKGKLTIIRSKAPTKADWMLDAIMCLHIPKPYNASITDSGSVAQAVRRR
ncbi:MAG: hypothetical protein Sw1PiTSA_38780 [Shewanella algae]